MTSAGSRAGIFVRKAVPNQHDVAKTLGPLALAALQLYAIYALHVSDHRSTAREWPKPMGSLGVDLMPARTSFTPLLAA